MVAIRSRRQAREAAIQALYMCDALGDWSAQCIDLFVSQFCVAEEGETSNSDSIEFARLLIDGAIANLSTIDDDIGASSLHWSVARMSRVDRSILRCAAYEIGFRADIPVNVTINEAIEIAKRFSGDESPMFINGVLDKLAHSFLREVGGKIVRIGTNATPTKVAVG